MNQNIFEDIQRKKSNLINFANKAVEFGWITEQRKTEIIEKVENDVLTIGVIGQMKSGKSTFLNAFIFEEDILPSATTPMTAALSMITYGEEKKIVAEFYTKEEWEQQKIQASRSLEELNGNRLEESRVKAAKELMEKSAKLGAGIENYLDKKQEDSIENLVEYVGADGKYVSITKSVTIYYPKEYLKGVEIVDTPGFNDPIVSREERTKEFLKKADVVLMMLFAGRPFDSTDKSILFENVRECGVGKIIIGINKYDIPYESGEFLEEIKDYVKNEIGKACQESGDDTMIEVLKNAEPIPLSAEMALLSYLPENKIANSNAYSHARNRAYDIFEIGNSKQLREKSYIDELINAIRQLIENEKNEILFRKPINEVLSAGSILKENNDKEFIQIESLIKNLQTPDEDIEDELKNLQRANKRLEKKIELMEENLKYNFDKYSKDAKIKIEETALKIGEKCEEICKKENIFNNSVRTFYRITMPKLISELLEDAKKIAKNQTKDFCLEVEGIFYKYIPDLEVQDFIRRIEVKIDRYVEEPNIKQNENSDEKENGWNWLDSGLVVSLGMVPVVGQVALVAGGTIGVIKLYNKITNTGKKERKKYLDKIVDEYTPDIIAKLQTSINNLQKGVIKHLDSSFRSELLKPLQKQLEEILNNKMNKELKLKEAEDRRSKLLVQKDNLNKQLETIELLKNTCK